MDHQCNWDFFFDEPLVFSINVSMHFHLIKKFTVSLYFHYFFAFFRNRFKCITFNITHNIKTCAVISFGRVEYLEDDEIVKNRFRKHDNYGNWDDYLGLEHAHTPGAGRKKNASRGGYADKPIKIHG